MSETENVESTKQTPEEVKANLNQQVNNIYNQLAVLVANTPLNETIKTFAIMNLDQGIYWVREGIRALNFQVETPEGASHEAQESNQEVSANEEIPHEAEVES